ncbi:MAG: hypothetical protein BroJett021_41850 [Chloroflexota bacterium]|nr:MAG: hypothetical protein BroJett021_41850 [Chloroflexota bacterium]
MAKGRGGKDGERQRAIEPGESLTVRNRRRWFVVSYDIPDDRRRTKVMKTLNGFGKRVQYSVFECDLKQADLERLCALLRRLIDERQDDVRIYGLCDVCVDKVVMLGLAQRHASRAYVVV